MFVSGERDLPDVSPLGFFYNESHFGLVALLRINLVPYLCGIIALAGIELPDLFRAFLNLFDVKDGSCFYLQFVLYVRGLQLFVPGDVNTAYGRPLDHDERDGLALRRILHIDHNVAEKTGLVNVLDVFLDLRGIVDVSLFGLCGIRDDPLIDPLIADDLYLRDPVGFRCVEKIAGDAAKNKKESQLPHSDRKINR